MSSETGIPRRTYRNWVVEFFKLRTFAGSPDWDHEHWIQFQILAKTKAYPYSHQIEHTDFLHPYSEPRKNKQQVKEIMDSHITDSVDSVLSDLFD